MQWYLESIDDARKYRYVAPLGMHRTFWRLHSSRQVGVISARWSSTEKIVLTHAILRQSKPRFAETAVVIANHL